MIVAFIAAIIFAVVVWFVVKFVFEYIDRWWPKLSNKLEESTNMNFLACLILAVIITAPLFVVVKFVLE